METVIIRLNMVLKGLLAERFISLKQHYGHKTNTGAFIQIVNELYNEVISQRVIQRSHKEWQV